VIVSNDSLKIYVKEFKLIKTINKINNKSSASPAYLTSNRKTSI
jgi:hypothetical protein